MHFAEGGEGAREMAQKAVDCIEKMPSQPLNFVYNLTDSIKTKIEKVAKKYIWCKICSIHQKGTHRYQKG